VGCLKHFVLKALFKKDL